MPDNFSNQSYVKFLRGSISAWEELKTNYPQRIDNDTLYFIYNENDTEGKLYLGNKLISGDSSGAGTINIADLSDIYIDDESLASKQLLVYNAVTHQWENADLSIIIDTAVSVMTGATAESDGTAGLVPAPTTADRNKFLRGDGTWQAIQSSSLNYAIKTEAEINQMIQDGDDSLSHTIFLIQKEAQDISQNNLYDEFMVINNQLERLGSFASTEIDLTDYIAKNELPTELSKTKIGNLNNLILSAGNTTLVEELNTLSDRMTWKSITSI